MRFFQDGGSWADEPFIPNQHIELLICIKSKAKQNKTKMKIGTAPYLLCRLSWQFLSRKEQTFLLNYNPLYMLLAAEKPLIVKPLPAILFCHFVAVRGKLGIMSVLGRRHLEFTWENLSPRLYGFSNCNSCCTETLNSLACEISSLVRICRRRKKQYASGMHRPVQLLRPVQ